MRLALRVEEAATSLSVSDEFFAKHIAPELRFVRRGRLKLVAVSEIERWLDHNSSYALDIR